MAADTEWPLVPTGDGRTVSCRIPTYLERQYDVSYRIKTPLLYGFHYYSYTSEGQLTRKRMERADIYEAMWQEAFKLRDWVGKLRGGLHARVVCSFLLSAEFCDRGADPRSELTLAKIERAVASAGRLRGKSELKAGLHRIKELCLQLQS